jgi:hypothetical protein
MSKRPRRSAEHPKVLLKRTGPVTFVLVLPQDQERLMHYAIGAEIEAQFWQERSLDHLRLYWAVLHQCVENSEGKYGRSEDLHDMLKVTLGYSRRVTLLCPSEHATIATRILALLRKLRKWFFQFGVEKAGAVVSEIDEVGKLARKLETECESILMPGSVAFDKMDQAEFKVFFEKAMEQLQRAGYPVYDYIEQGKQKLARIRASQPSLPNGAASNGQPKAA